MSDVSGIPYMGPMGMGNFFAPPFGGGGGNLSAGQIQSSYMPEVLQGQNTLNNLYASGGGFGRQTDYYSGLGASYSAQGMSPYGIFTDPGYGGGGGASPYQTSSNVFDTGASPFYGGGGSSGFGGSIYNSPQQSIDWGGVGQAAGGMGGFQSPGMYDPFPGMSGPDFGAGMFGGLAGGMGGANQGPNNQLDWSRLFDGGGGGAARADPAPGMSMPGGLNSPMTTPQAPPIDFGSLFGQGVGGTGGAPQQSPYTSGIAPDETGGRTFGERFDALGGSAPMGEPSQPQQSTEPQPVEGGRGGLAGASDALLGYTPQQWSESAYDKPSDPLMDRPLPGNPYTDPEGGGVSAVDLGEQARIKLAELMAGKDGKTLELATDPAKAAELPVGAEVPLPQPRPEGADASPATPPYPLPPAEAPAPLPEGAARPPASVPFTVERGKEAAIRAVQPRLSAAVQGGATFLPPGYTVEAYSGERIGPGQAYHRGGHAMDVRIIGPDGPIPSEGADRTGMYTLLARGVKTWAAQNDPQLVGQLGWGGAFGTQRGSSGGTNIIPDLMHFDLGGSRGALRPEVQFGRLQPLTAEERNAMPAYIPELGANQVPLDAPGAGPMGASASMPLPRERPAEAPLEQRPGVNQGQDITPPPAAIPDPRVSGEGFNALDAAANAPAAVKHSGLELARANIDTPIEKIAMERGGQKAVDQVSSMAVGMSPRQLMQSYGGMFMSRAEPLFTSLGITRQDFEKAITMPPTRQDLKMRFGEGGGFGPYPDYTGPEAAPGGTSEWLLPMPSSLHPDITDERGQLANTMSQTPTGFTGSGTQPTPAEREGMDALERLQTNIRAREEGRQPDLSTGPRLDQPRTMLTEETGLPDLPFNAAPDGRDALANVIGPRASAFDFDPGGYGEGGYGNVFEPASDPFNQGFNALDAAADAPRSSQLAAQRADYAGTIRDDPNKSLQLAARLYSEDQNSPVTRQAILEAMLNRLAATGQDPLNLGYYPKNTTQYNNALKKVSDNPDLLSQLFQEMEGPFGGSNTTDYSTDWASSTLADTMRRYATPTWTSPSREQFFRKDFSTNTGSQYDTGAGIADNNRRWYESLSSPPR